MDQIQKQFEELAGKQGWGISNRYSPGYCGWNVAEQQILFALLPPNPCNISLTQSSLMQPIKSISGIIGFGPDVKSKGHTCQFCEMQNCIYRNRINL
jgi:cobalamin-dependent methionine synthase I